MDKLLANEIDTIVNCGNKPRSISYEVILETVDCSIFVKKIESVEILKDYNQNYADSFLVTVMIPLGDFVHKLYNQTDNMEISLVAVVGEDTFEYRMKAMPVNSKVGVIGKDLLSKSIEELNKESEMRLELQCVSRVVEGMRAIYVDGIYKYTDVGSVIKAVLSDSLDKVIIDGDTPILEIDVVQSDNSNMYRHIKIPSGQVMSLDLPTFLQNDEYGVYNGNIGTYIQYINAKEKIFVYPLYNTLRFENEEKKLMLYNTPDIRYQHIDKTYMVDGDIVKIVTTSDIRVLNPAEDAMTDKGVGYVVNNSEGVISKDLIIHDDTVTSAAELNMSGKKFKDRNDGVNKPRYIGSESNEYKIRSDFVKESMLFMQVTWNFCNHELIFPGMPVSFIFYNKDDVLRLNGTVLSGFYKYTEAAKTESMLLNIAVENPSFKKEE